MNQRSKNKLQYEFCGRIERAEVICVEISSIDQAPIQNLGSIITL